MYLRMICILSSTERTVRPILPAISALVNPSSFQRTMRAEVGGRSVKQPLDLLENDDLLLVAGLSPVDVLEHPARKERPVGWRVVAVGSFAADVAAGREMTVGRVDDLAHRDPDQQFPQLLAARRRCLAFELPEAKAGVDALKYVLFVFAAANAIVEVPPHQARANASENRSQMTRAASSRSRQSGERRRWTHSVSEPIELIWAPRSAKRTHGTCVVQSRRSPKA